MLRDSTQADLFDDPPSKPCLGCKQVFPLSHYWPQKAANGKTYRQSYCRVCSLAKHRQWSRTAKGMKARHRATLTRYGLTASEHDAMFLAQGGLCAICGKPEKTRSRNGKGTRKLCIDHSHTTGKVRALLCTACNSGIARFQEDPALLHAAILYLQKHSD